MRRRAFLAASAVFLLLATNILAQTYGAVLTSSQEVPACAASAFGNATVSFDSTRQNINVTITISNLGTPINNFHIHEGPAGVQAGVVINLIGLGGTFNNGTLTGTFPVTSAVAERLLANPGNFYVNVHTQQCPSGVARGQLSIVSGGPITYAAELRAAKEVPPATSNAFGSAFVTFDPINNTIAWEVNTSGIVSPSLSHIHRGSSTVAGPVIINFATSAAQIPNGRTSGSGAISTLQTAILTPADLTNLASASTANGYYVNVHSSAFPGGEVRGQLVPAIEHDIPISGHVTNAIGQTFITDLRIFNPSYDTPATALIEYFPAGTSPNTNATVSAAVNLPARGTAILDDVTAAIRPTPKGFLAPTPDLLAAAFGTGALRVSSASQINATSRVFADQRSSGKGTFGQFVPAHSRTIALRRGVMPQLSNRSDLTSGFRTNVGLFNPNTGLVTVRLELRDSAGALVGTNTITVQSLSQQQNSIGSYFPGVDLSNSPNLTLSFDASAPILVYAAVNDNVSSDSILVPAQPDTGIAASQ